MNEVKWLLIIAGILLFLLLLIIFTRVKVYFHLYHNKDQNHMKLEFRAWYGLIKYKIDIPLVKIAEDSPTLVVKEKTAAGPNENQTSKDTKEYSADTLLDSLHDTKEILHHVVSLYKIIQSFLKKITIKTLSWHTLVGVGDAALTGMITGAFWSVKGSLLGFISHYFRLKAIPDVTITPQFQFAVSQTALTCMFHFRIGHAMVAGIKLIKYWKGGMADFRTKPLSVLSDDKTNTV
ncbi:DUF2953 domain-containing protein [Cytobacillus gottheilii]|uniref:DUF2953 domain-containing protein n=1 Tax=Cytobacillus gottheilii TaxID=859144 RepID=UPI0031B8201E